MHGRVSYGASCIWQQAASRPPEREACFPQPCAAPSLDFPIVQNLVFIHLNSATLRAFNPFLGLQAPPRQHRQRHVQGGHPVQCRSRMRAKSGRAQCHDMKPSVRAGRASPQPQGMKKGSETPQIHLTASSTGRSSQHTLYTSSPAKQQTQEPLRKRRHSRLSACFGKGSDKEDNEGSESNQRAKRSGKKLVRMWRYHSIYQMALHLYAASEKHSSIHNGLRKFFY